MEYNRKLILEDGQEYYGYGKLRIYTMVDGAAKEVIYDCRNRGTQYQDSFYSMYQEA